MRMAVPHGHWKTTTLVAGLGARGVVAPWVLDGPLDRPESGWTLVHCWSHVRRRFVKVLQSTRSPVAETMIRYIAGLYAVEKAVRGHSPDARLAARRQLS
ncbi:hypothetical protein CNY89_22255, partial [Amaricoccus sp. HAR-UPW-R2A-40]